MRQPRPPPEVFANLRAQYRLDDPFFVRYCGNGDLAACRVSLWAAMDAAGSELAAVQGADPAGWRADATKERIVFAPGILRNTMRGANRPTFQQLISFKSHR